MSATDTLLATPRAAAPPERESVLLAGLAISSFAALLLELALTRLFSVVLFYHFAVLAISIALLGLGTGGVFAYLLKNRLKPIPLRVLAASLCCMNAISVPLVLQIVLHLPVSLELSRGNFLRLSAIYLASAVPFFLTGLEFSIVFSRESHRIARLYCADLAGGALACLGIVPLLNRLGGPNTILFAAAMSAIAAAVWATARRMRRAAFTLTALLLLLIAANYSGKLIDVVYAKGIFRDPSWVEFVRWNAISRIEVDRQGDTKAIVIDADASTYIMNARPEDVQSAAWQKILMSAPPALVNILRPRGNYAIIGPGGGVDVLRAIANGSPGVTGIEINPIIANTVMRGRYAGFAYHLYERPDVHIHVTDGRSFIRNTSETYDVVQMTLVDTWASTAAGAFALSENSLYTVEAFREYFEHLRPGGLIAITRWEFREPREALRVVSVAMEALHQLGVANPARNFIVVSDGNLDEDGIAVVVLAKKSAFTLEEEQAVRAHLDRYPKLVAQYLPSDPRDNPFSSLIATNNPQVFAQTYPYNVAPVSDNAPFFFFTLKLRQVLRGVSLHHGIDWKVNLGVVVLAMVLIISLAAVVAFLVVPLALHGRPLGQRTVSLSYFVAIGLGFILVEIAFIQRFVLFLGHPTYALTVVVFLLLLSSGAGSLASNRLLAGTRSSRLPLILIACAIPLYVAFLPGILNSLVGSAFLFKLLVSAVLLVPLGFFMGMPFPNGLGAISVPSTSEFSADAQTSGENAVEWAWAMNAGASVLGSVLAMVLAIAFGLNVTLACGGAAYLLAILISGTLQSRTV
jgi:hypothetical protein